MPGFASECAWVRVEDATAPGGAVHLEANVYRPAGTGPHPVILFHHGSTGPGLRLPTDTERPEDWARHLCARGIGLVAPMRRGRGRSGGLYQETYFGGLDASRQGIRYALASAHACGDFLRAQAWVDARRIVIAGTSRGGMLALWQAANWPGSCAGVVCFVPGWTSDRGTSSGAGDVNWQLLDEIAGRIRVPVLLLYAQEDSYYSRESTERHAERLSRSEPAVAVDWLRAAGGHRMFAVSPESWRPRVDAFIDACVAAPVSTS